MDREEKRKALRKQMADTGEIVISLGGINLTVRKDDNPMLLIGQIVYNADGLVDKLTDFDSCQDTITELEYQLYEQEKKSAKLKLTIISALRLMKVGSTE